jgi:hypothetical protein
MQDYSYLEGKIIKVTAGDRFQYKGIVSGCDYDIGITIQNADDHDNYLVCLHGTCSPYKIAAAAANNDLQLYKKVFNKIIKDIQTGHLDQFELEDLVGRASDKQPSADTCPFSQ